MRTIPKGCEPVELLEYKALANENWKPTYDGLDKKPIREALVREQGYICCYCGTRIGQQQGDCHIEHLIPQSESKARGDDHLTLDYSNMMASCQGKDGRSRIPEHCGQARGQKPIPVSPLAPDCASFFKFGSNGSVEPAAEMAKRAAAAETIRNLCLDASRLVAARRAAIDGAIEGLGDRPTDEWQTEAALYDVPDQTGRLAPFCFAIQYVLLSYA